MSQGSELRRGDKSVGPGKAQPHRSDATRPEAKCTNVLGEIDSMRADLLNDVDARFAPMVLELETALHTSSATTAPLARLYRQQLAALTEAQRDTRQLVAKRLALTRRTCEDLQNHAGSITASPRASVGGAAASGGRAASTQNKLDLHGLGAEEAKRVVDRFLREAHDGNELRVIVIHGQGNHSKGGPVLRAGIRAYLSHHRLVERTETAGPADGGDGATIAYLRRDILPARGTTATPSRSSTFRSRRTSTP